VVSNHQSFADIVLLPWVLRSLNVKFVAKEELRRGIPTVSMALTYWGSALITREANRDDIGRMRAMARGLRYWEGSVVIFPEGTRSRECGLLPYKAGAVRIVAKEARLPLLPVAIDGTHVAPDLSALVRFMPGARGAVTIGTPVPPDVWDDRLEEVVEEIRTWASETIVQGRRDGTVPPPAGWIDEQLDSCVLANAIADD
jgi:1-acyl-sn-glycerol-3-phosphate acyltransferase